MNKLIQIAATLTILLTTTNAAFSISFEQVGPPGGAIRTIAADRRNPGRYYAGGYEHVYRSDDGARTWKRLDAYLTIYGNLQVNPADSSVFVHSQDDDPQVLTLFKSTDAGDSFVNLGAKRNSTPSLIFDPHDAKQLYRRIIHDNSGSSTTFEKSSDGGFSWSIQTVNFKAPESLGGCDTPRFFIDDLMVSPFRSETLYISAVVAKCRGFEGRYGTLAVMIESNDRGVTWKVRHARSSGYYRFAWDPKVPDRAYAYSHDPPRIERLTKSGWEKLTVSCPELKKCTLNRIVSVPGRPGELLALVSEYVGEPHYRELKQIYRFRISEHTWINEKFELSSEIASVISQTEHPENLLASLANGGIYRKIGDGKWKASNDGLEQRIEFRGITSQGPVVYAYTPLSFDASRLFYRSEDAGRNWTDLSQKLPPGYPRFVAVDPSNASHVLLETLDHSTYEWASSGIVTIWSSHNGGHTWSKIFSSSMEGSGNDMIVFAPSNPSVVYFTSRGKVFVSRNGGRELKQVLSVESVSQVDPIYQILVDRNSPENIYVSTCGRFYFSTNAGSTFQKQSLGLSSNEFCRAGYIAKGAGDELLIDNDTMSVYRTPKAGAPWKRISHIPAELSWRDEVTGPYPIFAGNSESEYWSFTNMGLWQSNDGGYSWKKYRKEISMENFLFIEAMSDPRNATFFLATRSGIFKVNND